MPAMNSEAMEVALDMALTILKMEVGHEHTFILRDDVMTFRRIG